MPQIYNYVVFHYIDKNGQVAQSNQATQDQDVGGASAYAALASAAQDCCDAAIVAVQYVSTLIISATPGDGPYCTAYDRAALLQNNAVTNVGQRSSLVGPKQGIFLPGNMVVNLGDSRVIAYQGEVQALIGDELGNPVGPFKRGVRQTARGS